MLHLFQDDERQTYAANDLDHAKSLWKADTGQDPDDTDWMSVPDDKTITVADEDGAKVTKTAAEWAAEYGKPGYCFGGE